MTRSELARRVAGRTGMRPAQAEAVVKLVLTAMADALARGETVRVVGFGKFTVRTLSARTVHVPRTGAWVAVPESRSVSFRPSRTLKGALNRPAGQTRARGGGFRAFRAPGWLTAMRRPGPS